MLNKTLLAIVCLCFATKALLAKKEKPDSFVIESIEYNGNGCLPGSVSTVISPDSSQFSVLYDSFAIETDTAHKKDSSRCVLKLQFNRLKNYAVRIVGVDTRGFVALEEKTTAAQKIFALWEQGIWVPMGQLTFQGPKEEDFYQHAVLPAQNSVWSPCLDKLRRIKLETVIQLKGKNGMMTVDSTDGVLEHKFALEWKKCH